MLQGAFQLAAIRGEAKVFFPAWIHAWKNVGGPLKLIYVYNGMREK